MEEQAHKLILILTEAHAFTVNPTNRFSVNSNGQISMNFDVSGSAFTFDNSSTMVV